MLGIILITPYDEIIPMEYKLAFDYTNNMVEYKALILDWRLKHLSNFIISRYMDIKNYLVTN